MQNDDDNVVLIFADYFDHNFLHKTPNKMILLLLETRLRTLIWL